MCVHMHNSKPFSMLTFLADISTEIKFEVFMAASWFFNLNNIFIQCWCHVHMNENMVLIVLYIFIKVYGQLHFPEMYLMIWTDSFYLGFLSAFVFITIFIFTRGKSNNISTHFKWNIKWVAIKRPDMLFNTFEEKGRQSMRCPVPVAYSPSFLSRKNSNY